MTPEASSAKQNCSRRIPSGVFKSGCLLSSWNWGQECPQNPQAGKPALHVAQTFLSAGSGDFLVARPSPTFDHTSSLPFRFLSEKLPVSSAANTPHERRATSSARRPAQAD